ncbi:hypothetical protein F2Q69_00029747 [Brassica cretica]|uniref:Uncharacterized protein n=1 Tax=Brassica cretica TaxID=69181 RepID=A0A8S9S722_BRACR|nr:hypothetical protein F2Q69_00029747 [Brassica cretica]
MRATKTRRTYKVKRHKVDPIELANWGRAIFSSFSLSCWQRALSWALTLFVPHHSCVPAPEASSSTNLVSLLLDLRLCPVTALSVPLVRGLLLVSSPAREGVWLQGDSPLPKKEKGFQIQVMLVLFEFVVASILSSILLFTAYVVCGLFLYSGLDQAVSGSVSKILYSPDYEGSVTGSLRCFLRVLGGGGLAVV